MRRLMAFTAAAMMLAVPVGAQGVRPTAGPELRTVFGALVPTGAQRDDFKSAEMLGIQLAREMSDYAHIVGSFTWAHSHNKFTSLNDRLTYIWQYDVGAELNAIQELPNDWYFRPFIGAGIGGRTYDYKAGSASTNSCTAGYGNVGTEFQRYSGALRLDVRDNFSCFHSPVNSSSATRNDLGLSVGIVYHIR